MRGTPATLLDFQFLALAGEGGMGTVHRARRGSGELVAVKLLTPRVNADVERFVQEGELLRTLQHPHIVRYVAHGVTAEGDAYLAMEWLEGEDLSERLMRGPLSVDEVLTIGQQVASALALAHGHGVVHRDIKPSNIYLVGGRASDVRVLDFGVARIAGGARATRTGAVLGTPGYMAPEQARGERGIGAPVDVFGLGCVLYECLTGRPAFWAEHLIALLARILLEHPTPPGELAPVPRAVDELIMAMLAKDPGARPADGAAVLAALEAVGPAPESAPGARSPIVEQLGSAEQEWTSLVFARDPNHVATANAMTLAPGEIDMRTRVASLVEAHGPRVAQLFDGTVVLSLPSTRVPRDGAVSAARCALAVARGLGTDATVAVVTGRGVRGSRAPLGGVIDQAARLLALARSPDGPRLDAITAGLLDNRFALGGDASSLTLKSEHAGDEVPRRLLGQPSPCVGRDRELASLDALYGECVEESAARAVLITAAPGSGKSRLRVELVQRLGARTPRPSIWLARADAMSAGSPRGLLIQLVRSAAGLHDGESVEVLRRKLTARVSRAVRTDEVPRVSAFLGELVSVPFPDEGLPALRGARRDPVALGDQIADAWEDFLVAELGSGPVVLILEDLHWGDLPTIRACDRALRRLRDKPLCILATARPEVHDIFPNLWAGRALEEIRLGPLTHRAAERLVRTALAERATDELVARIVDRAEGNAFVLEELIRAAIAGEDRAETALALTAARLGALPDACRRVLRAASVFGEAFWQEGVGALVGDRSIEGDVERLVEEEIVEPRESSRFERTRELRFRHALLRDAAYAMLTPEDLAVGHRLAGTWLLQVGERDDMTLAEHFDRGGEAERAGTHWARAAERALEGNDFAGTVRHAERALATGGGELGQAGCYRLIADAEQWRGSYGAGLVAASKYGELSPVGSEDWYRSIMFRVICLQRLTRLMEIAELADLVANAPPLAGTDAVRIEVLTRLAMRLNFFTDRTRVPRLLDLAESLDPGDVDAARGWLEAAKGTRAHLRGDLLVYISHTERAAALLEAAGNSRDALSQQQDLCWWWYHAGSPDRAEATSKRVIAAAERMGLIRIETNARLALVWQLAACDRNEEAIAEASRLLSLTNNASEHDAAKMFLGFALIGSGRAKDAIRELGSAVSSITEGSPYWQMCVGLLAEAHMETGDHAQARAWATRLAGYMGTIDVGPHFEVETRSSLAKVWFGLGDHEAAKRMAQEAYEQSCALVLQFSEADRARVLANVSYHRKVAEIARQLGIELVDPPKKPA